MAKQHSYTSRLTWTGAVTGGTTSYTAYSRAYRVEIDGKPPIDGSADPMFRGDSSRHNPEDLLLAALSACHMLWYLHLCADAGVVVTAYSDQATGTMELSGGTGQFREVTLHPRVTVTPASDRGTAERLHARAHANCFIARSVNFPVHHAPAIEVAAEG